MTYGGQINDKSTKYGGQINDNHEELSTQKRIAFHYRSHLRALLLMTSSMTSQ